MILVFCIPKYSVHSLTDFIMRILLAKAFTSSMVASRIALELQASIFGTTLRLFSASYITSLSTPINLLVFTSRGQKRDHPIGHCLKDSENGKQLIPKYKICINFLGPHSTPGPFLVYLSEGITGMDFSGCCRDTFILVELPQHAYK